MKIVTLLLALLCAFNIQSVSADSKVNKSKEKPLPQSGVLASVGAGLAGGGVSIKDAWGGVDMNDSEDRIPITGSITKSQGVYNIAIQNNSEDAYSVNLEFAQWDKQGATLGKESFSSTIRAKGTSERSFSAPQASVSAQLFLRSWKNLTPPKKTEVEAEAAKK